MYVWLFLCTKLLRKGSALLMWKRKTLAIHSMKLEVYWTLYKKGRFQFYLKKNVDTFINELLFMSLQVSKSSDFWIANKLEHLSSKRLKVSLALLDTPPINEAIALVYQDSRAVNSLIIMNACRSIFVHHSRVAMAIPAQASAAGRETFAIIQANNIREDEMLNHFGIGRGSREERW